MQITATCVPENEVQLITAALPQTACERDADVVVPRLDQLEQAGRKPEEMLADTLYTGAENVRAAAARGVDLVGPVPGRAGGRHGGDDGRRLRVGRHPRHRHLPRGSPADVVPHNEATARTRIEMPASACCECPFRQQCPIENTRDDKCSFGITDKERRLAGRRVEEATAVSKERDARVPESINQ